MVKLHPLNHPTQPAPATNELLLLLEAGQEINQSLQLDEVLQSILTITRHITRANLARLYLADRAENLNPGAVVSKNSSLADAADEDEALFSLARQVALTRQNGQTSLPARPGQILLLMPLLSRNKLMGVLVLGRRAVVAFPDNQVHWLSVFGDRAAMAIENAHLFRDLSSAYIDLAQSRETILHSRNTLQVLFEGITDDLYIVDQDLTINALNRANAVQPNNLARENSQPPGWVGAAPELFERITESLKTGRQTTWIPPEHETDPYLKDREFRIYPIRNRLGQVEHVLVFAQDVSERRRLQASLFRSANLASVGQLAGSVAHQINNPLTVAMVNSQLILNETNLEGEAYELTQGIFKATERIQGIVKNLLDFSNQESYFFIETDLVETIEGALELVSRTLKRCKIEVRKDYQVLPRLSASVSHLKLVWMNLLLNARDAVDDYADQPLIIITTQMVSAREVKVTIVDNGEGITGHDFNQLFRPFFTTKPPGRALGLGLYSAHAIIERHNGHIKATSQPGTTMFEVILPLDNPRDL